MQLCAYRYRHGLHLLLTVLLLALAFPARAETLHIRGDRNYPPYEFLDNGQPSGFNVELFQAVADTMGLDIRIDLGPWTEVRSQLENGEIDAMTGMYFSTERSAHVEFSSPFITVFHSIFVPEESPIKTFADLRGKEVLIQAGDIIDDHISSRFPDITPVRVPSQPEALRMLAAGKHDAALIGTLQGLYNAERYKLSNIHPAGAPFLPRKYCFAVPKGRTDLLDRLTEGLAILKRTGQYAAIHQKWFGRYEQSTILDRIATYLLPALAVGLALFGVMVFWTWSLRRTVARRTGQLRSELRERKKILKELEASQQRAEAANMAKSEFLANMSHEIRTPLNGIQGMFQLLQTTDMSSEQREYVTTGLGSSHRLTRLLGDILDLSKVESGKMELQEETFSLEEIRISILELFSRDATGQGLVLEVNVASDIPPWLRGDGSRLRQILNNLVTNALKFTEHGSVRVEASLAAEQPSDGVAVLFTVSDTGIGIPKEMLNRIFKPFRQVDGSYSRKVGGAGLGLSIVKRLVELMDGEISVQSRPGQGSVFRCTLPFTLAAEPPRQSKKKSAGQAPGSSESTLRVLLAEDDPVNRAAAGRMLEKMGCTVQTAVSGREALDHLQKEAFDMVFMDIQMPVMDGLEATAAIRSEQTFAPVRTIPIIALTAHAMAGDRERMLEAGMNDHLPKPLDFAALTAMVRKWSGRHDTDTVAGS